MITNVIIFLLALLFLIKGSDYFIRSAATLARRFGISEFVIGLTLVAFGTSVPELASSIMASIKHESGIVIGNVVGSNIANIGLIAGIAAIIITQKNEKANSSYAKKLIAVFTTQY